LKYKNSWKENKQGQKL